MTAMDIVLQCRTEMPRDVRLLQTQRNEVYSLVEQSGWAHRDSLIGRIGRIVGA